MSTGLSLSLVWVDKRIHRSLRRIPYTLTFSFGFYFAKLWKAFIITNTQRASLSDLLDQSFTGFILWTQTNSQKLIHHETFNVHVHVYGTIYAVYMLSYLRLQLSSFMQGTWICALCLWSCPSSLIAWTLICSTRENLLTYKDANGYTPAQLASIGATDRHVHPQSILSLWECSLFNLEYTIQVGSTFRYMYNVHVQVVTIYSLE